MERVARFACPPTMPERPHNEGIIRVRVVFFNRFVRVQGAVKVFGIEPAAHGHHGRGHIFEVGQNAPFLPKLVVVGMFDGFFPIKIIRVIPGFHVFERPDS